MEVFETEIRAAKYRCAYCGEINSTFVDPSQGRNQEYIEDCQVCCQPNHLNVYFDEWEKDYHIRSEPAQ